MRQVMLSRKVLFFPLFVLGLLVASWVSAQENIFEANPTAVVILNNGEEVADSISIGDAVYEGKAPMTVQFESHVTINEDSVSYYQSEWRIYKDGETYVTPRFEEDFTFDFRESGIYRIEYVVTYNDADGNSIDIDNEIAFHLTVGVSILKVPNAFSPNGDGINDIFRVKHESLVRFNAYVFNRWGQQLYHWGLSNIDDGWDGTYKGKPVKDGVYFIVIEAVGSEGKKYNHRGDINILRGFSGTGSTPEQ